MRIFSSLSLALLCALHVNAYTYKLSEYITGNAFTTSFSFLAERSDNGGRATYLSLAHLKAKKLISLAKGGAMTLRVSTKAKESYRGSQRLVSKKTYNGGLFIFDVAHIPTGCGTWPAIWLTGNNWPADGEIDIIEGISHITQNSMSTHTNAGCTQTPSGFSGEFMMSGSLRNQCNVYTTNSQGCGVRSINKASYGPPFNSQKGGVYALLWDGTGLHTYYWPRSKIPSDIKNRKPKPSSKWGTPENSVAASGCHPTNHFKDLMIVINTNLCGVWPAGVWGQDLSYAGGIGSCSAKTGYSQCSTFVDNEGSQMTDAFWTINSIAIYK